MTQEELFDQFDEQIGDKIEDESIPPEVVAENLKDIVRFSKMKTLKRTITHAELLAIATTPIVLIPAAVGKLHIPEKCLVRYVNNDGFGGSGGNWRILLDTIQMTNTVSQMGGATVKEQMFYLLLTAPSNSNDSWFNKPVTVTMATDPSDPVNPLAYVELYLSYTEIDL